MTNGRFDNFKEYLKWSADYGLGDRTKEDYESTFHSLFYVNKKAFESINHFRGSSYKYVVFLQAITDDAETGLPFWSPKKYFRTRSFDSLIEAERWAGWFIDNHNGVIFEIKEGYVTYGQDDFNDINSYYRYQSLEENEIFPMYFSYENF